MPPDAAAGVLNWDNCNIAAATDELRRMFSTWTKIGKAEEPDSVLCFRKEVIEATNKLFANPTVSNAQRACRAFPLFRNICRYHCPNGEEFRSGTLLGARLVASSEAAFDALFDEFSHSSKYKKDELRVREALLLGYCASRWILNTSPEVAEALHEGVRHELAKNLFAHGVLHEDEEHAAEVFDELYRGFVKMQPEIDENYLEKFEKDISNGDIELMGRYHERLSSLLRSLLENIGILLMMHSQADEDLGRSERPSA